MVTSENVSTQNTGQSVSPIIKVDPDNVVHCIWADNSALTPLILILMCFIGTDR